jgi:exonuclease III
LSLKPRLSCSPLEIISWNVNSVRARLPRVAALLARRQPDLVMPAGDQGRNLCSEPEREHLAALLSWGLTDLARARNPGRRLLHCLLCRQALLTGPV